MSKVDRTNKAKFQLRFLELALRPNKGFRIVDLTESTLVLKENKVISGQNYYTVLFVTGLFIWALTTKEMTLIVSIGLLWIICTLGFVVYPVAVKRQIFIVDLSESMILYRTGAFDKLKRIEPLSEIHLSAEIDQLGYDGQDYYRTTFYMQKPNHRRNIVLQMDSLFLGDCEKFQKAMCRYFKNVCQIQHIRMTRLGRELSLKDLH